MKLDTQVRLMGSLNLASQGIEDIKLLTDVTGTVVDSDANDVQVAFDFEQGAYHSIIVWIPKTHVGEL